MALSRIWVYAEAREGEAYQRIVAFLDELKVL